MFSKLTKFPMNQLIFKLLDKHYESSSVDRNAAIKSNSTSGTNEESKALDELIQLNCRHWNDFEIVQLFLKTMNPNVFENHHFKDLNLILKFSLLIYGDKIFEQVSDLLDVQIGSMLNDNADLKLVKFEYYPIVLKNSQDGFVKWKVLVDDLVQFISGCCSKESIGIEKNDQNTSIEKERNFDIDSRLQQFKIDWILARQAFDSLEIPKTTSTNTAMNVLHELVAYAAKRYDNEEKLYIENLFNSLLNLHLNQFDEYYEILKLLMQMDTSLADQMSFLESSLDPLNYSVRNSDFLHSCIVYHSKARSLCNFVDKCYNICQEHNWLYDDTIFNDYLLDCIEKVISGVLEVQVFQLIQSLVGYTFNEFEHSSKKAAVKRACTIFGLLLLRCIRVFKGPNKKYFQEFLLGLYNNHLNSIFCDEIHSLDIEMCLRINFVAMQVCDAYCGYLDNSRMKNMAVKYKDAKNEYVGETLLLYIDYCISKNIESHELAMILWEMGLSPPVLMDYISVLGHHPAEKHLARLLKNVIHGNVVVIPEFYECLAVKDLLVPILIKIAGKLFKTHDVKLGFFLSSLNKKISLEHAQFVVGHNFTTFEDENGVTQVISFLETVPIQFFTTVQLEQLQLLLFVIEKSVPLTNTLRKLTSKFLLQKVDRSLLFFHPSTLLHFVQTCQISAYKESLDIALACIS